MRKTSRIEERFFRVLMFFSTAFIAISLLLIVFSIVYKGLPSLSWEMLTQEPKGGFYFGKEGGILNAILGSFYLAIGATLLAMLIAIPVALFINVHLRKYKKSTNFIRFLLDLMWGVPSIVYGAFAFGVMIYLGVRTSLLAGIITVTLFIIPIMIRSFDEVLKTIPNGLLESTFSLGATLSETSYRVVLRQCIPGFITSILLSFGRAIGDAAAVMFTAGFTDSIPTSLNQPAATLPLSIFFQLSSPIPEVKARAYTSALVLTVIILLISIFARYFSRKYEKNKIRF